MLLRLSPGPACTSPGASRAVGGQGWRLTPSFITKLLMGLCTNCDISLLCRGARALHSVGDSQFIFLVYRFPLLLSVPLSQEAMAVLPVSPCPSTALRLPTQAPHPWLYTHPPCPISAACHWMWGSASAQGCIWVK